ncbi:Uncharacterized conserved protein, DUF924 family [Arsukibacterium tuosuense]|uniref:Uncharacterized conserved protein, DUF924 family n=1 Tax=Arsukibacterium tuosuense TaxID=1323745 RepID=A0A285ICR7_9GAMM|nr:DUF924 family protein [Arsukibacterium tuosuense]SNY45733.1 Uncharacterized conserved protein, DUF924 family [Arsukibacterium tuosuense]
MPQQILDFWFKEISPSQWWAKDPQFDQLIASRFGDLLQQAASGELYHWRNDAKGRLAEIIVLDQFSRNIFRDTATAFSKDPMALVLAQEAVTAGVLQHLSADERSFLLLPYMHSESPTIHKLAESLYKTHAPDTNYQFELKHKAIIDRFGRYPHRNAILRRTSTAAELEFLKQPGSGF